jgi:pro-apoptotic serine protease NMA111
MKKNEHYFPTMEWIKDPAEPCGWSRRTHESGRVVEGETAEGLNTTSADANIDDDVVMVPETVAEQPAAAATAA